jgi:SRSO17 transposase
MERKNGWQMAEFLGDETPHAVQRLLGCARWNADDLRDELIRYAMAHLLTPRDSGVLIVDETGFPKKGNKSVGVQRQYSGTAGRVENCQVGVFLALASAGGRALIDRALYLPRGWCEDKERCREASVPPEMEFATKPQLAQAMLARAFENGMAPQWVLADAVYGSGSKFRRFLESREQPYVLAVSSAQRLWVGFRQQRVDAIAKQIPPENWLRLSVGDGAKGPRVYDWAAGRFGEATASGLCRWVLFRRSLDDKREHAYYFCLAPAEAAAGDLAIAAGRRWSIECCFEAAKQETGLDEYEVRSWHGWHRHVTLSLLAVVRARANRGANVADATTDESGKKGQLIWCR